MERRRRLVPGIRIRTPIVLRLRRILAHRHRCSTSPGVHSSGELLAAIRLDQSVCLLDALAHVAFVLDSRLCLLPCYADATRPLVAQPLLADFDGAVWPVAQGDTTFPGLGLLSRSAPGRTPPARSPAAQI